MKTIGVLALGFSVLLPMTAGATGIKPGAWKVITSWTKDGKPMTASKRTCITKAEADDPEADFRRNGQASHGNDCKSKTSWNGTDLTWHLECTGKEPLQQDGKFTYDQPTHVTGEVTSSYMGHPTVHVKLEGSMVGDCVGAE